MDKRTSANNGSPGTGAEDQLNINADENIRGTEHLSEPVEEEDELMKLREEIGQLKEKYLRQAADFDNFRKRNAKEKIDLIQSAGKEVIGSMLEVLDDCDRAEKQMTDSNDLALIKEGIQLVFHKLRGNLQSRGLKIMDSLGEPFNPDRHEAIGEIPVNDEAQKGLVVDVVEKGYYLNDKIIRFAKVMVGK